MKLRVTVLSIALLSFFLPHRVAAQNQILAIEGGTLIDGTGKAPIKDSVIVIEGPRIKAVGTKESVPVPAQAKVIRADGKTILPGLIDAHIHELNFFPQLFPYFGVTTVFDIANPTGWSLAQREALRKGRIKGPRMFVTGVVIDGPAINNSFEKREDYLIRVRTPEEARAATRSLIRQGVDAIKVYQHLTADLLQAIVEETHKAGLEAVGHSHDARADARVGLKFIEHSTPIAHSTIDDPAKLRALNQEMLSVPEADMNPRLFGPLIDAMVKKGIYYNPTLGRVFINVLPNKQEWYALAAKYLEDPTFRFIPAERRGVWLRTAKSEDRQEKPADLERQKEGLRKVQEFTRAYAKAGGKIIAGTDAGPSSGPANMAGLALHLEMEALVDAGLSPMQAILSSTLWSAQLFHKEKDLGTVEPGRLADIILIDGDPLANIRATRNVRTVIMDGRVMDTALDPNFSNPLPRGVAEYPMDSGKPELVKLTPDMGREHDASVNVEVTGKKFTSSSVIRFDTTDLPTRFVSDSKLTATLSGALLKSAGAYAVTVINPGSGGGTSKAIYFTVNSSSPRPASGSPADHGPPELMTLTPDIARERDAGMEIEVTGKKFTPQSVIRLDATNLPTKFVSESKLTGMVSGALLKNVGTFAVTVVNPGSGGGTSKEIYFVVNFRE